MCNILFKLFRKGKIKQTTEIKESVEEIYTPRDAQGFAEMPNKEFFTNTELVSNEMNNCIEFDNAIASCNGETIARFLGIVVPDMQEELGIAFYGISPKSRNLLLNAMPIRRATVILDNMLFLEEGVYRSNGKESINKACKMMLDILTGNESTEKCEIRNFAVSGGDDPTIQFESFILDAQELEIKRVLSSIDDSDLSVALYCLCEKAKERLFAAIGEERAESIKEDYFFMDNPGKRDVRDACAGIVNKFDDY